MASIYRFISFETFMDVVLRKSLTFVHPSLWEDPYEIKLAKSKYINNFKEGSGNINEIQFLLTEIITNKLYGQSWTHLPESDALWRIYDNNKSTIRIEVDLTDITKLNDVEVMEVKYINDESEIVEDKYLYDLVKYKRMAFAHEAEVRLIKYFKYKNVEEAEEYIIDYLKLTGEEKFFRNIEIENIQKEIERVIAKLNVNIEMKTSTVYYGNINNFIKSVMLTPFAPNWLSETLEIICEEYDLNYLGKSDLYT